MKKWRFISEVLLVFVIAGEAAFAVRSPSAPGEYFSLAFVDSTNDVQEMSSSSFSHRGSDQRGELRIPKGFGSDLQIEAYGAPGNGQHTISVSLSNNRKMVSREIPLVDGKVDIASVVVPAMVLESSKSHVLKFHVTSGEAPDKGVQIVVRARKQIKMETRKAVDLNVFVPVGIGLNRNSAEMRSLIERVNEVYSFTGIEFKLRSFTQVPAEYLDIQQGFSSYEIFEKISRQSPYGLNVLLAKNIFSPVFGGYSPQQPGPSSKFGVKKSGVLIRIPYLPIEGDADQTHYWVLQVGNNLAHEIGHYLGLPHTYETGPDQIFDNFDDTPTQSSNNLMDPERRLGAPQFLSQMQIEALLSHPMIRRKGPF